MDDKPKRVSWRNVACVVLLGSPFCYYASSFIEPPYDAPRVTSPEGRRIFREMMIRNFPSLFSHEGAPR